MVIRDMPKWQCFYETQVRSLPCLVSHSVTSWVSALVELYSNWICQSSYMDFSKLLDGFVKIDIWISLVCYMNLSKLIHWHLVCTNHKFIATVLKITLKRSLRLGHLRGWLQGLIYTLPWQKSRRFFYETSLSGPLAETLTLPTPPFNLPLCGRIVRFHFHIKIIGCGRKVRSDLPNIK